MANKSRQKLVRARIIFAACSLVMLVVPFPTSADVCWDDYMINQRENPAEFIESISEVIFVGTVVAKSTEVFEHVDRPGVKRVILEKTSFDIDSVTKGNLSPGEDILVYGKPSECSCIGNFTLGEKYLVYAIVDDRTGKIMLRYCNFMKKMQ